MIWLVNINLGQPGWHCSSFRNLILLVLKLKIVGHSLGNQGMRRNFSTVFNGVWVNYSPEFIVNLVPPMTMEVQLQIVGIPLRNTSELSHSNFSNLTFLAQWSKSSHSHLTDISQTSSSYLILHDPSDSHLTSSLQTSIILLLIDLLHSCHSHMNVMLQSFHSQTYYNCSCVISKHFTIKSFKFKL